MYAVLNFIAKLYAIQYIICSGTNGSHEIGKSNSHSRVRTTLRQHIRSLLKVLKLPSRNLMQVNPRQGQDLVGTRWAEIAPIPETKPLLHPTVQLWTTWLSRCYFARHTTKGATILRDCVQTWGLKSGCRVPERKPVIIMQRPIHARLALIVSAAGSTICLLYGKVGGKQGWEHNTGTKEQATLCTWGGSVNAQCWALTHTSNAVVLGALRRACAGGIRCRQGEKPSIADTR